MGNPARKNDRCRVEERGCQGLILSARPGGNDRRVVQPGGELCNQAEQTF